MEPGQDRRRALRRWRRRGSGLLARGLHPFTRQDPETSRRARVSQAEVQGDLQRFASSFIERVVQATDVLAHDSTSRWHEIALRRALYCSSSALDIASGVDPAVGMLDMVVFVTLSRDACACNWMEHVGEEARDLMRVLDAATDEIWQLARKIVDPEQEQVLKQIIERWKEAHPNQQRVEGVRFLEFSELAREAHRIGEESGLASRVQAVTARADQALLLGERAMFLIPRMPFLIRLNTRVGALEVLEDATAKLTRVETLLKHVGELEPLLERTDQLMGRAGDLTGQAGEAIAAARELSASALPLLQGAERLLATDASAAGAGVPPNRVEALVRTSEALVARAQSLFESVATLTGPDPARALGTAQARIAHDAEQLLWKAGAIGATLIALFWAGYFVVVK